MNTTKNHLMSHIFIYLDELLLKTLGKMNSIRSHLHDHSRQNDRHLSLYFASQCIS
jgi:hypothetical protein